MTKQNFVIASDRPWSRELPERLSRRIGGQFTLINRPGDLTPERLGDIAPSFVFFPHWSHKIPATVHERFECIVFHMSDVPYGRGGSPLQNLVSLGHTETMISALRCVDEIDAGPVFLKRPLCLHGGAEEILLRASDIIEGMVVDIIRDMPEPVPQQGEPVVFARRTPSDGNLAKAESLSDVHDMIRMLDADGYPPAFLEVHGFRLEFRRSSRRTNSIHADVIITRID